MYAIVASNYLVKPINDISKQHATKKIKNSREQNNINIDQIAKINENHLIKLSLFSDKQQEVN